MKNLAQSVAETNCERQIEALALMKKNGGCKASDYLDTPFSIDKWVIGNSLITESDDETGEVIQEHEDQTMTIKTTEGEMIGTNSKSVIREFKELSKALADDGIELSSQTFQLVQGVSANGRKFTTLELVF